MFAHQIQQQIERPAEDIEINTKLHCSDSRTRSRVSPKLKPGSFGKTALPADSSKYWPFAGSRMAQKKSAGPLLRETRPMKLTVGTSTRAFVAQADKGRH